MAKHRHFDSTEKVSVQSTWMTMKRIWSYLSSAKWLIGFVLLLVLTSTILSLVAPYLLGYAIDHYLLQIDPPGLIRLIILLAVVYLTTAFANWFQHFLMVGVAQKSIYRIREQLFNKLHKLPIQFFDNSQQGDIMSRITNDLETVSEMLNNSVIQLFASVLSLIGTLVFMLYL